MEVAGLARVMLPDVASLDYGALGLTALALMLVFATRLPMLAMIAVLAGAGLLLKAFGLS
jgi:chromate transporter